MRCAGCGAEITQVTDDPSDNLYVDPTTDSARCGPGNPMSRGDDLDPFHEPEA